MEQRSLFDDVTVTDAGEAKPEAAAHSVAPPPCPYSMRFPHKQYRRSAAIRRLYDRYRIDDAQAAALLKPISRMNEGCWAKPFAPQCVVDIWRSMRPTLKA